MGDRGGSKAKEEVGGRSVCGVSHTPFAQGAFALLIGGGVLVGYFERERGKEKRIAPP